MSKAKWRYSLTTSPRYTLTVFVTLFTSFFLLYSYSQRQTSGFIYWFDDWIFYADGSGTYSHMKEFSFKGNMWRHPLYPVIVYPTVTVIKAVFGLGARQAARILIALIAALNVSLFFLLLRSCLREKTTVLLFTCLYGFLFSNLVFFSIPETYSLANIGILVFFLLIIRFHANLSTGRAVILGFASGMGALLNPPLGLLLFSVYLLCIRKFTVQDSLRLSLWATLAALLVYLMTNALLFGFEYIENSRKLASKWASFSNYFHSSNWLNVGASFFLYSVISPLEELERSIGLRHMSGYFHSPVRALLLLGLVFYLVYAFYQLMRRGTDEIILIAAVWLTVFSVFHVYFNPREALLYSCQALAPFMLVLALVFADIRWNWKPLPLGLFSVGLAYVNLKCLQG